MIDKYENVIKKQQEIQEQLQKQLDANEIIMASQKQQIQILKKEVAILEKENKKLMDAGNDLFQSNVYLEEICTKQQVLLDELSAMLK